MNEKRRVLVAEGWSIMRDIIESAFRNSERYELVTMFYTAEKVEEYCDENTVDVLAVEGFVRKRVDGIEVAKNVKQKHPNIKILILVNCVNSINERQAREAGLDGIWQKDCDETEFLKVLDTLSEGGTHFR